MLLDAETSTLIFISSMIAARNAAASAIETLRSPTPNAPVKTSGADDIDLGRLRSELGVFVDPRADVLVGDIVELWQYRQLSPHRPPTPIWQ